MRAAGLHGAALAAVLLLSCSLLPRAALAQQVELEPSAVAACLTTLKDEPGLPTYPFAAYKDREPGRVLVELQFNGAALRPDVDVLEKEGGSGFVDAVREHARRLRVPCLPPGKTVRLRQEYVFKTDGRPVYWGPVMDPEDNARRALLKCMKHVSGKPKPDYPPALLRAGVQGRVLVRMRFVSDDQAPQAQVYARSSARALGREIEEWVRGYRLPCYAGEPIDTTVVFIYKFEGEAYGFRAMDLLSYAARTATIKTAGLQLDTNSMGCPFDVRLLYRQPHMPNKVGVRGPPDIRRQPLLDWLERSQLDLPPRVADSVFADTADIQVPCLNLDIPPDGAK